jgi:hypothetical protein
MIKHHTVTLQKLTQEHYLERLDEKNALKLVLIILHYVFLVFFNEMYTYLEPH